MHDSDLGHMINVTLYYTSLLYSNTTYEQCVIKLCCFASVFWHFLMLLGLLRHSMPQIVRFFIGLKLSSAYLDCRHFVSNIVNLCMFNIKKLLMQQYFNYFGHGANGPRLPSEVVSARMKLLAFNPILYLFTRQKI